MTPTAAPMLAHEFAVARAAKVKYPCHVQPKLDGVRMIARLDDGALESRNGTDFSHLAPLFQKEVERVGRALRERFNVPLKHMALDGELYVHGVPFQKLVSMVRNKKSDSSRGLQYHVYDIATTGTDGFGTRYDMLSAAIKAARPCGVKLVKTVIARTRENIETLLSDAEADGYEGIMVRESSARYASGKRSASLLKYKRFQTDEFTVVGYKEAQGKDKGTPIFELSTRDGASFFARPTGTLEERREMFKNADAFIGKLMTVQFQGLSREGVPRFPVALALRDYE